MRDVLGRTWKGNTRELRSYLEQAVVLSDEGILDVTEHAALAEHATRDPIVFMPLQAMVEETEYLHIKRVLERTDGSVSKTAELGSAARRCGKR